MKQVVRIDEVKPREYSVHGAPANYTRLALKQLVPDVDWVIAGIKSNYIVRRTLSPALSPHLPHQYRHFNQGG